VRDLDGVRTSSTSSIGTYFDQYIKNIYQPKEYNGYTNSALKNYQQEREFINETIFTTKDVHHAGIPVKMTTIYSNASKEEAYERR
jgi:hypothetical protein